MSANAMTASASAGARVAAEKLAVDFEGYSDPGWYAQEVSLETGPGWGRALITVPNSMTQDREAAGYIALNTEGPDAFCKFGTPVKVYREYLDEEGAAKHDLLWVGRVASTEHVLDDGSLVVTAYDSRWDMSEVRVVGQWMYDPENNETVYRQGWPALFNPGGRPNLIFDTNGRPRFAPYADYGLSNDEAPPAAADGYSDLASYWTLGAILEYLREFYGPEATDHANFPGLPRCPSNIVWPQGLGSALDEEAQANFNQATGQNHAASGGARKGRELNAEGVGLLELLEDLFFTSGGYTLALEFQESEEEGPKTALKVVSDRYTREGLTMMYRIGGAETGRAYVNGGRFAESGDDLVSYVTAAGALALIERLASVADSQLVPAWTTARFNAWREAIVDLGNDDDAFDEANRLYPEVLTCWKLASGWNFQAGTVFENFPRAKISRPPWPRQLTMMATQAGAQDFAGATWPTYVEINTTGSTWAVGPMFDGFEILDNGICYLPVLRDLNAPLKAWEWNNAAFDTSGGLADLSVRNIRMNLALPCDHRMTFSAKLAGLEEASAGEVIETPDGDRINPGFSKRAYVDLGDLYQLWLRYGSWPQPQSIAGVTQASDKTGGSLTTLSDAVRSDYELLKSYVRRRMRDTGRLVKDGELKIGGHLVTAYRLGMPIESLQALGGHGRKFPVRSVISGLRWVCRGDAGPEIATYVKLGGVATSKLPG